MESGSRENLPGSEGGIRRSGRSRMVNSKYATGIDELKRSLKRTSRKDRYSEEDSMFQSNQKDDSCSVEAPDTNWLECKLPEGEGHRIVWLSVVPPKRQAQSRYRIPSGEIRSSQCLKKKTSAFKEPVKQVENKKSSLLGVLLAAMNRVVGEHPKEEERESESISQGDEKNDNPSEKQDEMSNMDSPKKMEGKQRSKMAERNEEFKRYMKMEAKYNSLSARFQELKNKMSIQI